MSSKKSTGCTYSKFLILTSQEDSLETKENLIGTAADWSDIESEFSMFWAQPDQSESHEQLFSPSLSQAKKDLRDRYESELLNLAEEAGIEGTAKVVSHMQKVDASTLAVVSDDQSNLDLYALECDTLFVKQH